MMVQNGWETTRWWFCLLFTRMMMRRSDEEKNWNRKLTISVFIQPLFRWKVTAILALLSLQTHCAFFLQRN